MQWRIKSSYELLAATSLLSLLCHHYRGHIRPHITSAPRQTDVEGTPSRLERLSTNHLCLMASLEKGWHLGIKYVAVPVEPMDELLPLIPVAA